MNKKLLTILLIAVAFAHCKKDNKPSQELNDVVGTWSLYSYSHNFPDVSVSVDQYPCLSDNLLIFNSDQTGQTNYIGKDTCYITPVNRSYYETVGLPNEPSETTNWAKNGNRITLKYSTSIRTIYGTITNVNGQLQLKIIDTLIYGGVDTAIYNSMYIKK